MEHVSTMFALGSIRHHGICMLKWDHYALTWATMNTVVIQTGLPPTLVIFGVVKINGNG